MSLQAWYPLLGDTLDYSGNGNSITNSGATVNNNGKIGKCYAFDGVTSRMSMASDPINDISPYSNFSTTLWIKGTIRSSQWSYILHKGVDSTVSASVYCICTDDSGKINFSVNGNLYSGSTGIVPDTNTWYHLILVYSSGTVKGYVNGDLKVSYSAVINKTIDGTLPCIGDSNISYASRKYIGNLNDVRFYNHALSEKEVKEIAKAKILHYTFDECTEPTTNIVSNGSVTNLNGWYTAPNTGAGDNITKTLISDDGVIGNSCVEFNVVAKFSWGYYGYALNRDVSVGFFDTSKKYTISFWAKHISGAYNAFLSIRDGNGTNIVFTSFSYTLTDSWKRYSYTFTPLVSGNIPVVFIDSAQGSIHRYDGLQLEMKDYATPYVDSSRPTGQVLDASGYGNHAILDISKGPQWIINSKIGTGAYKFNGTHQIAKNLSGLQNELTLSVWINPSSTYTGDIIIMGVGAYYLTVPSSRKVGCYWYGKSPEGYFYSNSSILDNLWSLVNVVWSADKVKFYINGLLDKEVVCTGVGSLSSRIWIGAEKDDILARQFNGSLDDIRIYATALSDADILELYQTRMSLDNQGNFSVKQLSEDTSVKFNDTGVINAVDFSEVGITDKLYVWYPLSGNADDITTNNLDGIVSGAEIVTDTQRDQVYNITLSKHIKTGITDMTAFTNAHDGFTFSVFMNPTGETYQDSHGVIFGGYGYNWGLLYNKTGKVNMAIWGELDGVKSSFSAGSVNIVPIGQWTHIMGSFDKIAGKLKVYINGTLESTVNVTKPFWFASNTLTLGSAAASWWATAKVSQAKVFNKVLTDGEAMIEYQTAARSIPMKISQNGTIYVNNFNEV